MLWNLTYLEQNSNAVTASPRYMRLQKCASVGKARIAASAWDMIWLECRGDHDVAKCYVTLFTALQIDRSGQCFVTIQGPACDTWNFLPTVLRGSFNRSDIAARRSRRPKSRARPAIESSAIGAMRSRRLTLPVPAS